MKTIQMNQLHEWSNRPAIAKLFDILFLIISIATFRHTAAGFASIEGSILAGGFSAIAIDVTMYLAATALSSNLSGWGRVAVGGALFASALASAVAQLLFSVTHAQVLEIAPAAAWLSQAQAIIDYRVVWMPFSLPVFALLVTAAGKAQDTESVSLAAHHALQDAIQGNERELDRLEEERNQARADLATQQTVTQEAAARADELQAWKDQLQGIGINNRHNVVKTLAFAHNGNTPKVNVLAESAGTSATTVRNALKEMRQDALPEMNELAAARKAITPNGGVLGKANPDELREVANEESYPDKLREQARLLLDALPEDWRGEGLRNG